MRLVVVEWAAPAVVQQVMDEYAALTGRALVKVL